jgi:hypothetical protein
MKRIYLNTPISSLSRAEAVRIGHMAITWCKKMLGVNNRKSLLIETVFSVDMDNPKICGEYDDIENLIFIYYRNCDDVRELLATILHEWQHSLQPLRSKYHKVKGPYCRNPYEIEARKAEALYSALWTDVKPKVNRRKSK